MSAQPVNFSTGLPALRQLAKAPHRLMFFIGATNVLLAMLWWTLWLVLVAMVTRVTQGHSGRPLVLGSVAAFAFIVVQIVTVTRVLAELVPNGLLWQVVAAIGWLVAFMPWVARSTWIYVTPRADGKAG